MSVSNCRTSCLITYLVQLPTQPTRRSDTRLPFRCDPFAPLCSLCRDSHCARLSNVAETEYSCSSPHSTVPRQPCFQLAHFRSHRNFRFYYLSFLTVNSSPHHTLSNLTSDPSFSRRFCSDSPR